MISDSHDIILFRPPDGKTELLSFLKKWLNHDIEAVSSVPELPAAPTAKPLIVIIEVTRYYLEHKVELQTALKALQQACVMAVCDERLLSEMGDILEKNVDNVVPENCLNLLNVELMLRQALKLWENKQQVNTSLVAYIDLFNKNPLPTMVYDVRNYNYLMVNDAAVEKYGYTREEFLNMNIFDLRSENEKQRLQDYFKAPQLTDHKNLNWKHILKDGSEIDVLIESSRLNINEIPAKIVAVTDVTELKQIKSQINILEKAMVNFKDAVIVCTKEHDYNLKIVNVNESFSEITGYRPEEVIGKSPVDFTTERMKSQHQLVVNRALHNHESVETEALHHCKNGNAVWVQSIYFPVYEQATGSSQWIVLQRDIHSRVEAEQKQKILNEEISQNNKELQQFSYITSHNLRAPLANLTSLLHLYNRDNPSDPFNKTIIENFEKATNNLNETLNDLHRALVIRNNYNIEKAGMSLSALFSRVVESLQTQIQEVGCEIEKDFSKADLVMANRTYLQSIFLNLLSNSIKYRSPDRRLKISVISELENEYVKITFRDNGLGIDLNRFGNRLFGLYQRFHSHTEGKGLGLYLVKSQITGLGGKIEVESLVDEGTTFHLFMKNVNDAKA